MRRWIKYLFAGGIVASTLPLFGACTDDTTGVFIVANLARTPPTCSLKVNSDSPFFSSGKLDVALKRYYQADLMFGNQMQDLHDAELLKEDSTTFTVEGAIVSVVHATAGELGFFTVAASGFADSASGSDPGLGLAQVELIPAQLGDVIANELVPEPQDRTQIITDVKLFGRTVGGQELETPYFRYVIEVCNQCLIVFPETTTSRPVTCAGSAINARPCSLGQDTLVPCLACINEFPALDATNPCFERP